MSKSIDFPVENPVNKSIITLGSEICFLHYFYWWLFSSPLLGNLSTTGLRIDTDIDRIRGFFDSKSAGFT